MAEAPSGRSEAPEVPVKPIKPARLLGVCGMLGLTAAGLYLLWVQAQDPIFGLPLTHPVALVVAGLIVLVGVGGAAWVWLLPAREWRKIPAGPLSAEVRRFADAGREIEAIQRLQAETGAGWWEAEQVVEAYRTGRAGGGAQPTPEIIGDD
jgi:hypothetical protein